MASFKCIGLYPQYGILQMHWTITAITMSQHSNTMYDLVQLMEMARLSKNGLDKSPSYPPPSEICNSQLFPHVNSFPVEI